MRTAVITTINVAAITATKGMTMKLLFLAIAFIVTTQPAYCWDGQDSETGESVEIGKGNLVRPGLDIEIYDSSDGEYHDVTVEGMTDNGSTVEIEIYDNDTGEYRTIEMDD